MIYLFFKQFHVKFDCHLESYLQLFSYYAVINHLCTEYENEEIHLFDIASNLKMYIWISLQLLIFQDNLKK